MGRGKAGEAPDASRLFFAVVASGIALGGAVACSVSVAVADGDATPAEVGPAGRIVANPAVGPAVDSGGPPPPPEVGDADIVDAGEDADLSHGSSGSWVVLEDGGDGGWAPTK